ncbi:hypothetical protein EVJ58_g10240 [Rhodofomes roseus]|uniref:Uncharacterized protein n=1 Tax=Rhodofomes roseus TaxID=34475 RepID=A0A4Y9XRL2_9APHY|nr:hypothetical protein EVJ58_g10240 [Rhodofomes roseus]
MSPTPANNAPASVQPDPQGPLANTDNGDAPGNGERAASPTYAQVAARPPSPRTSVSSTIAGEKGTAAPPPTPQPMESPISAPFTQRGTVPDEDDDLGWTTVATPKKLKKAKSKKNKGKGKEAAPASPKNAQAAQPLTPVASPKSTEPRKRRRMDADYGDEDRATDKRQEAPLSLSLASKSPLLFALSSPSPSYPACERRQFRQLVIGGRAAGYP